MIPLANDRVDLPDGDYAGIWSSYRVRILRSVRVPAEITLETIEGCRSLSGCPVNVHVTGGIATVEEE